MFIIPKRVVYNCFTHIKIGIFSLFHAEIIFQGPSWTTEAIWTVHMGRQERHTCWIPLIHFQYRNLCKISMLNHVDWSFYGTFMEFSDLWFSMLDPKKMASICHVQKRREVHSGCADEVWLVPCGPRPDKPKLKTPALDRYCMCQAVRWLWWSWGFP